MRVAHSGASKAGEGPTFLLAGFRDFRGESAIAKANMYDRGVWSISLGRWRGVHVRLHMAFLLFAAFTLYLGWLESRLQSGLGAFWMGLWSVAILLLSVLAHELGHYFAATRLGGVLNPIVLGPLGGLQPVRVPHDPQSEFLAVIAGPLTNLCLCLMCFIGLGIGGQAAVSGLLNPLAPQDLLGISTSEGAVHWVAWVRIGCWVNWMLVLVNLIPAFPFDGGRACLAILLATRKDLGYRRAVILVAAAAKFVAVALVILAWFFHSQDAVPIVPTWFALSLLAIFVYFSARVEESQFDVEEPEDLVLGYDFSQGYTSLERSHVKGNRRPGVLSQWLARRRRQQARLRRQRETDEDFRVDGILKRLHEDGMEGLTSEERALLNRVSARYRSRESD